MSSQTHRGAGLNELIMMIKQIDYRSGDDDDDEKTMGSEPGFLSRGNMRAVSMSEHVLMK